MSVQTPHATFAQQRPDTAAPFLYKSQGLHVPVVTKSGTISVRPDQVLNLDRVETNMFVNPQTLTGIPPNCAFICTLSSALWGLRQGAKKKHL